MQTSKKTAIRKPKRKKIPVDLSSPGQQHPFSEQKRSAGNLPAFALAPFISSLTPISQIRLEVQGYINEHNHERFLPPNHAQLIYLLGKKYFKDEEVPENLSTWQVIEWMFKTYEQRFPGESYNLRYYDGNVDVVIERFERHDLIEENYTLDLCYFDFIEQLYPECMNALVSMVRHIADHFYLDGYWQKDSLLQNHINYFAKFHLPELKDCGELEEYNFCVQELKTFKSGKAKKRAKQLSTPKFQIKELQDAIDTLQPSSVIEQSIVEWLRFGHFILEAFPPTDLRQFEYMENNDDYCVEPISNLNVLWFTYDLENRVCCSLLEDIGSQLNEYGPCQFYSYIEDKNDGKPLPEFPAAPSSLIQWFKQGWNLFHELKEHPNYQKWIETFPPRGNYY